MCQGAEMVQGRRKKFQDGRATQPCPLLSAPIGTVLLQFVNITIECVGVAVEALTQKVYISKWE